MSILICFALKEEAAPFHKIAAQHPGVITLIVGIGRANAEKSIRSFLAGGGKLPERVFTGGFAGGLNPDLKLGDVVFEPAGPAANDLNLVGALRSAGAKPGKFFCGDRIATTVAEKKSCARKPARTRWKWNRRRSTRSAPSTAFRAPPCA